MYRFCLSRSSGGIFHTFNLNCDPGKEDKSDLWALSAQFTFSVCEYLTKAYFTSEQSLACMSTLKKVVQEKHSKSIR